MKVLLVSHTCAQRHLGQARAARLAASGIDLTVLAPRRWNEYGRIIEPDTPAEAGYRFVAGGTLAAFPLRPFRGRAMAWQWYTHAYVAALGRLLRDLQPDVLDVWEEPWSVVAAQAAWLRDRLSPRTRLVVETEQNIYKRLPPPFGPLQRYVLRRADYAVARSDEAVQVLKRKGYAGPATVIGNGVDTDLFRPLEREECRRQTGLADADFVLGYAGRIESEKGLETIFEALARLPERVSFYIIGAGSAEGELRDRARSIGIEGRVRWHPPVSPDDLPAHINAMDALVLPSRTTPHWKEQFGRVLIEAMACGVPVVGASSGAIPEVLAGVGEVFPEGDSQALSDRVHGLLQDPSRRAEQAARGREHAVARFSWQQIADRYRAVYADALSGTIHPAPALPLAEPIPEPQD